MKPALACVIALTVCGVTSPTSADPIHAIGNGDYWHHDSGWVFPERVGEFTRIGFPQDVAGSRDAVGHYERVWNGIRVVVDVDVFPADSAAEDVTLDAAGTSLRTAAADAPGQLSEDTLTVGRNLATTRVTFTPGGGAPARALYFIVAHDWRVRIRTTVPAAAREVMGELDAFVRSQKWEKLAG